MNLKEIINGETHQDSVNRELVARAFAGILIIGGATTDLLLHWNSFIPVQSAVVLMFLESMRQTGNKIFRSNSKLP